MIESQKFSLVKLMKSFRYASAGIEKFIVHERNAKIHGAATLMVIIAACIWKVNTFETIALSIAVGLVWIAEMLNSAIEKTIEQIRKDRIPEVEFIKDISAGAVLIAAVVSLIIGCLIFVPKIL
ncbi:MAG: diacylglycerol kinase family protein [Chitinophagales bacterium]